MAEELTQENFDEKIGSGLVAVDFWAPWCGPCKIMGPDYEEAGKASDATFYKLNAEDFPDIPPKYNIRGIPTVIFFKDKK